MMSIRVNIEVDEEEVWDSTVHGMHWGYEWWIDYTYDTDKGFLWVQYLNEDDKARHKKISKTQLAKAYAKLVAKGQTHCGSYPINSWDACSGDFILQEHIFGRLVYG